MDTYLFTIKTAVIIFFILSFFIFIPWLIYSYRKYGYLSFWASIVVYSFIFYMITALFLVMLPLPATRDVRSLQAPGTKHYSLIPFYFIWDVLDSSSVVLTQPRTYLQIFKEGAFIQAVFNFLLLFPFGVYLRYFFQDKRYWKKAFGLGFALSLFYEVTQITGIYGIYNAPYRIFDVDDLILNSTGTLLGFLVAPIFLALFPSQKNIIEKGREIQRNTFASPTQQLLAIVVDYVVFSFSWSFVRYLLGNNPFTDFLYPLIGFLIFFFLVPIFWSGKTIGTNALRFQLAQPNEEQPRWPALLKRTLLLGAPIFLSTIVQAWSKVELNMDSPLYPYQVWFTVGLITFNFIMWGILVLHALFILFRKGKSRFYFDAVPNIVNKRK